MKLARREIITIALGALLAVGALGYRLTRPGTGSAGSPAADTIPGAMARIQEYETLSKSVGKLTDELKVTIAETSPGSQESQLRENLGQYAQQCGLKLTSIRRMEQGTRRSSSAPQTVQFKLDLGGQFSAVMKLIYMLEHVSSPYLVQELTVNAGAGGGQGRSRGGEGSGGAMPGGQGMTGMPSSMPGIPSMPNMPPGGMPGMPSGMMPGGGGRPGMTRMQGGMQGMMPGGGMPGGMPSGMMPGGMPVMPQGMMPGGGGPGIQGGPGGPGGPPGEVQVSLLVQGYLFPEVPGAKKAEPPKGPQGLGPGGMMPGMPGMPGGPNPSNMPPAGPNFQMPPGTNITPPGAAPGMPGMDPAKAAEMRQRMEQQRHMIEERRQQRRARQGGGANYSPSYRGGAQ